MKKMKNKGLYDYYEISCYCKSEGINIEFFVTEISKKNVSLVYYNKYLGTLNQRSVLREVKNVEL